MAERNQGSPHANAYEANNQGTIVPPSGAVIYAASPSPCSQEKPCWTKDAAAEKMPPKWGRSEWVIVYVTVLYALIAFLTLVTIKRQADTMDRQNTIILNEKRPRLLLEPQPFESIINGIPNIMIRITNIGGSKAIFGLCIAGMEVSDMETSTVPKKNRALMINFTRGLGSSASQSGSFLRKDSRTL